MSNELVKELRTVNVRMTPNTATDLVRKAAARIEALEAENARLREALNELLMAAEDASTENRAARILSAAIHSARRAREGGNNV